MSLSEVNWAKEAAMGAQLAGQRLRGRAELWADREDRELGVRLPRQRCRSRRWQGRADPGEGGAHTTEGTHPGASARSGLHLRGPQGAEEGPGDPGAVEQPADTHGHGFPGHDAGESPASLPPPPSPAPSTVSRAPHGFWAFPLLQPLRPCPHPPLPEGVALHRCPWEPARTCAQGERVVDVSRSLHKAETFYYAEFKAIPPGTEAPPRGRAPHCRGSGQAAGTGRLLGLGRAAP